MNIWAINIDILLYVFSMALFVIWKTNMSETVNNENNKVDLESVSPELRHLIEFEEVPEEMHLMVASIHEASESVVRGEWDALPNSAQNILDNFEQFHALITISQAFASVNTIGEFDSMDMPSHLTRVNRKAIRQIFWTKF